MDPDDVDEQDRDLARLAAQLDILFHGGSRDLLAHVAAEQVLNPFALAQALDHAVEAGLELTDLAAVVDGNLDVELARLDSFERLAHRDDRIRDGARREHRDDECGHQRDRRKHEDGGRELAGREVVLGQRGDRRQSEAERWDAGAHRPGDERARLDPRAETPVADAARQGPGRDRTHLSL